MFDLLLTILSWPQCNYEGLFGDFDALHKTSDGSVSAADRCVFEIYPDVRGLVVHNQLLLLSFRYVGGYIHENK
jgi:hypothetical protein